MYTSSFKNQTSYKSLATNTNKTPHFLKKTTEHHILKNKKQLFIFHLLTLQKVQHKQKNSCSYFIYPSKKSTQTKNKNIFFIFHLLTLPPKKKHTQKKTTQTNKKTGPRPPPPKKKKKIEVVSAESFGAETSSILDPRLAALLGEPSALEAL